MQSILKSLCYLYDLKKSVFGRSEVSLQILSKETERGGRGRILIDGIIPIDGIAQQNDQGQCFWRWKINSFTFRYYPEAWTTSGNNYILDFLPSVFSWHFSEGEGGFHEDTSCSHALKSQKQHDCSPSATTSLLRVLQFPLVHVHGYAKY